MSSDGDKVWKRPASVPFPSVWRRFEGKTSKRQYWIQDITEEYFERILDSLVNDFIVDEPICKYSSLPPYKKEPNDELKEIWRNALNQKVGLMCLTKDEKGNDVLVGYNATCVTIKDKGKRKELELKNERIIATLDYISGLRDPFKEFNIDTYLSAMGLYVLADFRGESIGLELLKAREPLCKAVGIKASLTVFTSIISQKLAAKAGFKDFSSVDYDELEKINSLFSYPGITKFTKTLKYMYILY